MATISLWNRTSAGQPCVPQLICSLSATYGPYGFAGVERSRPRSGGDGGTSVIHRGELHAIVTSRGLVLRLHGGRLDILLPLRSQRQQHLQPRQLQRRQGRNQRPAPPAGIAGAQANTHQAYNGAQNPERRLERRLERKTEEFNPTTGLNAMASRPPDRRCSRSASNRPGNSSSVSSRRASLKITRRTVEKDPLIRTCRGIKYARSPARSRASLSSESKIPLAGSGNLLHAAMYHSLDQ